MKTVKELRKKDGHRSFRDEIDKHESYGMIHISNVSSGAGIPLFGSGIKHGHFIELVIQKGERTRDAFGEHYFGFDELISVYLSPAQFSGLLTRSNTPGVPCTINYRREKGHIGDAPEHNIKTEIFDDLQAKFKNLEKRIHVLKDEIDTDLKGPVKVATKEKIKSNVNAIYNDINSNLMYLLKCQTEKLEQVGNQIVGEAEASINSMIHNAGLEHLKGQALALKSKPKIKKLKIIKKEK